MDSFYKIYNFIIMSQLYKDATLSKLTMLEGKNIVYDDFVKIISQYGASSVGVFYKCIVRIANKRIIIGQKTLFGKEYALLYVFVLYEHFEEFLFI